MVLDFTTTAMVRPDVLERTYRSFARNLGGVELGKSTLHINVDPLPNDAGGLKRMEEVAGKFFGQVHLWSPAVANFAAAVKWCWTQPQGAVFFHLEDDWELMRPVHINQFAPPFLSGPAELACVNLRAYDFPEGDRRICLSPGLWRTSAARAIAGRMVDDWNPEKQLRPKNWGGRANNSGGAAEGFYGQQYPGLPIIKDIGRAWMARAGVEKSESTGYFNTWKVHTKAGSYSAPVS